ncbi:MAG: NirA family protein [Planctomycetales bacterium]|nr:NirA family protein [Planctomycetales bacterium]
MSDSNGFTPDQQSYLQGFALGADVARKLRGLSPFSDSALPPTSGGHPSNATPEKTGPDARHHAAQDRQVAAGGKLCAEEVAKRNKNGLDLWNDIQRRADENAYPKGTDVFLQKYFGLFYVAPAQDSYMCRLRFPGGMLKSFQLRGLADLADQFAGPYSDVTTRANLQLREIPAANSIHILTGLRDLGIVNTGAGADNIRNVTASPLGGIDATELVDTQPLARQMHYAILHQRDLFGLPRKFNIAFDGGGRISALEDTNDVGFQAVAPLDPAASVTSDCPVWFRLILGGITGHRDFARSTGVYVKSQECVNLAAAIVRVYLEHGNRTDRKKARLKYLLDEWGFEKFLAAVETEYGQPLRRIPDEAFQARPADDRTAHINWHPQSQPDMSYVGISLPVGRLTSQQMRGLSDLADRYGRGELRLTVWQNIILPYIANHDIPAVSLAIEELGLSWQATHVRAGLIACTGNAGCKYAAANTKRHAMEIATYVDERVQLDTPINIHLTGCHHSCAQHYIGDIGLIGTAVSVGDDLVEGYHIHLGGGYGDRRQIAQELIPSVSAADAPALVVRILEYYLGNRTDITETFSTFANRITPQAWQDAIAEFRTVTV